jgi:hypothetical protein
VERAGGRIFWLCFFVSSPENEAGARLSRGAKRHAGHASTPVIGSGEGERASIYLMRGPGLKSGEGGMSHAMTRFARHKERRRRTFIL